MEDEAAALRDATALVISQWFEGASGASQNIAEKIQLISTIFPSVKQAPSVIIEAAGSGGILLNIEFTPATTVDDLQLTLASKMGVNAYYNLFLGRSLENELVFGHRTLVEYGVMDGSIITAVLVVDERKGLLSIGWGDAVFGGQWTLVLPLASWPGISVNHFGRLKSLNVENVSTASMNSKCRSSVFMATSY